MNYTYIMLPDILRNGVLSLLFISIMAFVYLVIRAVQNHFDDVKEQKETREYGARQYRDYVSALEERNRILEHQNEQQRQTIHAQMCKELQNEHERKVTNGRLKLLANEIRATDNTRATRVFKPYDLQKKLNETNKTMNLVLCQACLDGCPEACSGECDGA